jgi:membrane protease YdiL (CAAX protease family)
LETAIRTEKTLPDISLPNETTPIEQPAAKPVSWRLFWLLALAVLLAALLVLPYALQVMQAGNPQMDSQSGAVRQRATISAVLQAVLLYWPLLLLGLLAAGRIKLGLPLVSAWMNGQTPTIQVRQVLRPAALLGFGMGFAILAVSAAMSHWTASELMRLNASLPKTSLPNVWQSFLGSISAGINEEILLRLFLLSGLAWCIQWLFTRRITGRPGLWVLWVANLLAALVFGLLHLPNLSALNVPVSPYLLVFVVALNGAAGLSFGWLYWSYGLESAILAHFFMDLILHVLTAALQGMLR